MMARRARLLTAATATATVLTVTLSGCVTVHGENAVVPAASKAEAAKALKNYTAKSNKANETYDPRLNATVETGALGAIDRAGLKARKSLSPQGAENFSPLKLTDARFLIPKQAGWPKFFVADTLSNRTEGGRWFLVFQRASADAPWKATYLSVLEDDEVPDFAMDSGGYAKTVPAGTSGGLAMAPGSLSEAYTRYLEDGSGDFAPGAQTSRLRESRKARANQTALRTDFEDQPAQPPQYTPVTLRTKDGGAVVFFASHHYEKQTAARGYRPPMKDALVKELMKGKAKQSATYTHVSQQSVAVPPKQSGGNVRFLNRIYGVTAAQGQ